MKGNINGNKNTGMRNEAGELQSKSGTGGSASAGFGIVHASRIPSYTFTKILTRYHFFVIVIVTEKFLDDSHDVS